MAVALLLGCAGDHGALDDAGSRSVAGSDAGYGLLGAACATDGDCGPGLQCATRFPSSYPECPSALPDYRLPGGYCTVVGTRTPPGPEPCSAGLFVVVTACPEPTTVPQTYYCARPCSTNADCREAEGYFCTSGAGAASQSACAPRHPNAP
jgi:hypothetical protein